MSDAQKQQAYNSYSNAKTDGTLQGLHDTRALSNDFTQYINNFQAKNPDTVDTSEVTGLSFSKQAFYKTLFSSHLHLYYSNALSPAPFGPGNTQLVEPIFESSTYTFRHHGLTQQDDDIVLENPRILVNSNSIVLEEGLVKILFRVSNTMTSPNGSPVWTYQLLVNNRLQHNYYLVDFTLL